jgi:hypothetical protein
MKRRLIDAAERAAATFAQAFLAALTVQSFTDVNALELAAVAAGYAVAKYLLVLANEFLAQPPQ